MSDYIAGYDDGYLNGYANGAAAAAAALEQRDEHLARRIVAMLLQHDTNQQIVASVLATQPYAQRGIPRRSPAELSIVLDHAPFENRP